MRHGAKISILPRDYREQKSREQALFQEKARGNPEMIKKAGVFRGIASDCKIEIKLDPSLASEDDYVY